MYTNDAYETSFLRTLNLRTISTKEKSKRSDVENVVFYLNIKFLTNCPFLFVFIYSFLCIFIPKNENVIKRRQLADTSPITLQNFEKLGIF